MHGSVDGAACVGNVAEIVEAWQADGGLPAKLVIVEHELDRELGPGALDEHLEGDSEPRAATCRDGIFRDFAPSWQFTARTPGVREISCSPPSGRTTVTRRSITPVADGLVTCTPSCNMCPICAEHCGWSCVRVTAAAGGVAGELAARARGLGTVPGVPGASRIPRDQAGEYLQHGSEDRGNRRWPPEDRPVAAAQLHDILAGLGPRRPPARNRAWAARCHRGRSPSHDRTSRRMTRLLA